MKRNRNDSEAERDGGRILMLPNYSFDKTMCTQSTDYYNFSMRDVRLPLNTTYQMRIHAIR